MFLKTCNVFLTSITWYMLVRQSKVLLQCIMNWTGWACEVARNTLDIIFLVGNVCGKVEKWERSCKYLGVQQWCTTRKLDVIGNFSYILYSNAKKGVADLPLLNLPPLNFSFSKDDKGKVLYCKVGYFLLNQFNMTMQL